VPPPSKLPPPLPPPPRPPPPSQRAKSSGPPPPPSLQRRNADPARQGLNAGAQAPLGAQAAALASESERLAAAGLRPSAAALAAAAPPGPQPSPGAVAPVAARVEQAGDVPPSAPSPIASSKSPAAPAAGLPAAARPVVTLDADTEQRPPTVRKALAARVLVGRGTFPLWTVLAAAMAATAAAAALLVLAAGAAQQDAVGGQVIGASNHGATAHSSAEPRVTSPGAAARPSSLAERAAAGEAAALQALQARSPSERTSAETVALAAGRVAQQRNELSSLGERLRREPELASKQQTWRALLRWAADPRLATDAVRVVATIPASVGPDLLFHIWTSTPERTDTTRLAEELLFSKDVRARASAALSVVLDLRDVRDCAEVRTVVERAVAHADRRALVALGRLQRRQDCGPRQRRDCSACLQGGPDLDRTLAAAGQREPPCFE
jgi:hypothetical protein